VAKDNVEEAEDQEIARRDQHGVGSEKGKDV
jgi:hypothetical protein